LKFFNLSCVTTENCVHGRLVCADEEMHKTADNAKYFSIRMPRESAKGIRPGYTAFMAKSNPTEVFERLRRR
jgi:hypothetical protein